VDGSTIVEELVRHGHKGAVSTPTKRDALWKIGQMVRPGDVVMTLGAGDVHEVGTRLAEALAFHSRALAVQGPESQNAARLYEMMSQHTTLRVGGPARFWYEPATEQEFIDLVKLARAEGVPVMVLGRGSNLLVRDGGIAGAVICPDRGQFLETSVEGDIIRAGCGVKFKRLAAVAKQAGLGGFEWMEGIPGNVGGSIRMNAGAMGVETFDQVVRVRFLDEEGNVRQKTREEIDHRYRSVPEFQRYFVLSGEFRGVPTPLEEIEAKMKLSMDKRKTSQPVAASAGCIFKNPSVGPAGRLVDELGCKNQSIGAARVSEVHGNFIVNDGGASASEVLALIDRIKDTARTERGVELETEVQIIGEDMFPW
jgi:UDP-N-acetylenolpyruvoylglucosamine reductase